MEKCETKNVKIFQDKIRLLQDDLESEREIRQRVSRAKMNY